MAALATAKGSDINAWRAAGEFGSAFRQVLLKRSAHCFSDEAEDLFDETCHALEALAAENDDRVERLQRIVVQTTESVDPSRLGELCNAFYAELYDHFGSYGSAIAFYHLSSLFLRELTGSLNRYSLQRLGLSDGRLPGLALVAMGPTGRRQFSPFCPLQLALVYGQAAEEEKAAVSRYCMVLQECFEACGLQVDGEITPLNAAWRGSLPEWDRRLEQGLSRGKHRELVELIRLADHEALFSVDGRDLEFRDLVLSQLQRSRRAMGDLVTRLGRLSNGLGLMGGLLLERSGPYRGLFRLFEHALLPLSAAVSALALINRVDAVDIPLRIRSLLGCGALDVDTAERLLQSWHILNELRLMRERELFPARNREEAMYMDVTALDEEKRRMLREALETIENVQRRVSVVFSGSKE